MLIIMKMREKNNHKSPKIREKKKKTQNYKIDHKNFKDRKGKKYADEIKTLCLFEQ